MSTIWFDLGLVCALIGVIALLAGAEMAVISLREGQLRRIASQGRRRAALARDPNRYLSAVQFGITLAGFLASATAAVSISEPVATLLDPLGQYARPAAIALVTIAVSFVSLVCGELVPKRLAMQQAEKWSLAVARPISMLIGVTRPIIAGLSSVTNIVVRSAGGDPTRHKYDITHEEIADLVDAQAKLTNTHQHSPPNHGRRHRDSRTAPIPGASAKESGLGDRRVSTGRGRHRRITSSRAPAGTDRAWGSRRRDRSGPSARSHRPRRPRWPTGQANSGAARNNVGARGTAPTPDEPHRIGCGG
ncbi:MAG: putative hemolysin [Candidatus Poriferisodalaceae bacterium]|jgi:putative hemolysin